MLEEVVVRIMGHKTVGDVVGGLYHMPTIRADVFVCSAMNAGDPRLHLNVLVFEQVALLTLLTSHFTSTCSSI